MTKNQHYVDLIRKYAIENSIDIKTIFELGSRDLLDSISLRKAFHAKVHAFEANPVAQERMLTNILDIPWYDRWNIYMSFGAINTYSGICDFYQVDDTSLSDIGGSSVLKFDDNSPVKFPQRKISVNCDRLDNYCIRNNIQNVDLIWSDLQGFDAIAISTLDNNLLSTVKIIFCEVEYSRVYDGSVLFPDVLNMFGYLGMKLVYKDISKFNPSYGNCMFAK